MYDELRKLAAAKLAQEKPGQTLQATALVHDAYLRLVDVKEADETFFVNLSGASSNALISVAQEIGTILDDDIHPKK